MATVAGFDMTGSRPGKALLHLNHRSPVEFDLYETEIATGELTLLAENPGHVAGWMYTPGGDLYAQIWTADGRIELTQWDIDTGQARPVTTFDGADYPLGIQPFQLTPDGTGVWLGSNRDTDRTRLVRLDLATGRRPRSTATRISVSTRVSPSSPPCRHHSSSTGAPES